MNSNNYLSQASPKKLAIENKLVVGRFCSGNVVVSASECQSLPLMKYLGKQEET